MPRWIDAGEAARRLGVPTRLVLDAAELGEIPTGWLGPRSPRFRPERLRGVDPDDLRLRVREAANRHQDRELRRARTRTSWQMMLQRCTNPNATGYENYGGRGIAVCGRWRASFEDFLADMGERPEGRTLDRIDVDGNYEPDNCRWATPVEQRHNRRIPPGGGVRVATRATGIDRNRPESVFAETRD